MSAVAAREVVGFRRSPALPGIEIVDAEHSPREWRIAHPSAFIVFFRTWRGPVRINGRTHAGEPGSVFCNMPGDAMVSRPDGDRPGSFNVIEFLPEVMHEWLAEQRGSPLRPEWAEPMQRLSPELRAQFLRFFDTFEPEASPLQLQSQMLELSQAMVRGLIVGASDRSPFGGPPIRGTARMRECLHEADFDVDLDTLAAKAGLSRFQALRAFKRRYGLPPHAYQLCVRLGKARAMMVRGAAPADVAAACGFVDQSHFNRHFKRAYLVTPMQYARGQGTSVIRPSGVFRVGERVAADPSEIVARSDWKGR